MCGFILRSEVDQGSKHLKLAAFVNNKGYEDGEKVIYGHVRAILAGFPSPQGKDSLHR